MYKFRTTKVIDDDSHIYNFLPLVVDAGDIDDLTSHYSGTSTIIPRSPHSLNTTHRPTNKITLFEIDVLFRIHHPYIMHADKFVITADGPGIMLPAIDSISFTSVLEKTTKEKIPILYKILSVHKFLREHQPNGGFDMADIIFTENNDILIYISEKDTNITHIIRYIIGDFTLISDKYQNEIEKLFTMPDKLKSSIFDPYREEIQFTIAGDTDSSGFKIGRAHV